MTVRVVAPASTANLGPGFDAAAAALDLGNDVTVDAGDDGDGVEIEGEGADELPRDATHLALRAFAFFAPPDTYRFRFVNRIPLERGLGSGASTIALGLLAGATVSGRATSLEQLLAVGEQLEGHADNLAAALYGGVCVTAHSDGATRVSRIADMPAAAILAVPATRTNTVRSRGRLPRDGHARRRGAQLGIRPPARRGDRSR